MLEVRQHKLLQRTSESASPEEFQNISPHDVRIRGKFSGKCDLFHIVFQGGKVDQQEERRRQKQMKVLKKELRHLLSQPLFKGDLKTKYPTQSGQPPVLRPAPRNGESALSCLSKQKRKPKPKTKEQPQQEPQPSTSASSLP